MQAIAAMDAALRADSGDLEVLLALGVSHTNEMEASEALGYLQRWLGRHPAHGPAAAAPAPPDASQRHLHVVRSAAQPFGHRDTMWLPLRYALVPVPPHCCAVGRVRASPHSLVGM